MSNTDFLWMTDKHRPKTIYIYHLYYKGRMETAFVSADSSEEAYSGLRGRYSSDYGAVLVSAIDTETFLHNLNIYESPTKRVTVIDDTDKPDLITSLEQMASMLRDNGYVVNKES